MHKFLRFHEFYPLYLVFNRVENGDRGLVHGLLRRGPEEAPQAEPQPARLPGRVEEARSFLLESKHNIHIPLMSLNNNPGYILKN